jgi:hypothetical protein
VDEGPATGGASTAFGQAGAVQGACLDRACAPAHPGTCPGRWPVTAYGTSSIKRHRRTKLALESIRGELVSVLELEQPCTVRQVYYRLESQGAIAKTESEYRRIARLLSEMRREGRIPYSWIADSTRWMRRPQTWASLEGALAQTQAHYRRALWNDQDAYVEVWLEKDALAGVLYTVTSRWDVPLMVSRGFASLTFLHSAAETIASLRKPTHIYYFGDHDPSGLIIPTKIEQTLRELAPRADITFTRAAVTPAQIKEWDLPTRPTKREGNAHAKRFDGESVEVDAIAPTTLRAMCQECIEQHIDPAAYAATLRTEQAERYTLDALIRRGLGGAHVS